MPYRPAPTTPYLTASGRIDMGYVEDQAHRRVQHELDHWTPAAAWSVKPTYDELLREKRQDELYRAQIERRRHVEPARDAVPLIETFQYSPIYGRDVRYAGGLSQGAR